MRKKRLAFAKFSFMMAVLALLMLNKPSQNVVVPMLIGQVWSGIKLGTQIGHNTTPEKFFVMRTFLSIYNVLFLFAIWYKIRQARREKVELEYDFFVRVDAVLARMSEILGESKPVVEK